MERGGATLGRAAGLEHDPEKRKPVFGQDHAEDDYSPLNQL
jgi:hypothetical protein